MGDSSVEVTDENREAAQDAKMQAMEAISEGNLVNFAVNYNGCFFVPSLVMFMCVVWDIR